MTLVAIPIITVNLKYTVSLLNREQKRRLLLVNSKKKYKLLTNSFRSLVYQIYVNMLNMNHLQDFVTIFFNEAYHHLSVSLCQ